jgi:hypothetical protein
LTAVRAAGVKAEGRIVDADKRTILGWGKETAWSCNQHGECELKLRVCAERYCWPISNTGWVLLLKDLSIGLGKTFPVERGAYSYPELFYEMSGDFIPYNRSRS